MLAFHTGATKLDDEFSFWPHREFSQFVNVEGIRFHVQIMGQEAAETVLLVHGTGAATHSWRDIMPELATQFRVIALDLPGHGFTEGARAADLSLEGMAMAVGSLLKQLNICPTLVIGHSAGVAILFEMHLRGFLPGSKIVGLNAALAPIEGNTLLSPLAKLLFLNPMTSRIVSLQARFSGTSKALIKATGSPIDDTGIACYDALLQQPSHIQGAIGMMARWDLVPLQRRLPSIDTPVLLIAAVDDPMVPSAVSRKAVHLIPNARLDVVRKGGHLLHELGPKRVVEIILTWRESVQ